MLNRKRMVWWAGLAGICLGCAGVGFALGRIGQRSADAGPFGRADKPYFINHSGASSHLLTKDGRLYFIAGERVREVFPPRDVFDEVAK